jgi:hypothetical protein
VTTSTRGSLRRFLMSWLALPAAALAALLIGAVMLLALGANPLTAYRALIEGAFGSVDALADTAIKAVPILLVGVGICIAFRANVLNIGGEGQMVMGRCSLRGRASLPGSGDPPDPATIRRCGRRWAWGAIPALKVPGQRDPEHDHAQSRRRPGDELPAGGASA